MLYHMSIVTSAHKCGSRNAAFLNLRQTHDRNNAVLHSKAETETNLKTYTRRSSDKLEKPLVVIPVDLQVQIMGSL